MPMNFWEALCKLLGHDVAVTTDGGTFKGTVAGIDEHLLTLCSDGHVVFIRLKEINALTIC